MHKDPVLDLTWQEHVVDDVLEPADRGCDVLVDELDLELVLLQNDDRAELVVSPTDIDVSLLLNYLMITRMSRRLGVSAAGRLSSLHFLLLRIELYASSGS